MAPLWERWSDEMFAKLRELYLTDQYSMSQIASMLGKSFKTQISKSAVVAKLHRSGLVKEHPMRRPGRPTSHNNIKANVAAKSPAPTANVGACRKSSKATIAPKFDDDVSPFALPLIDANDNQCRWPVNGDGKRLMVCGAPIAHGAYCERHSVKNADAERRPKRVVYRRMFREDATR